MESSIAMREMQAGAGRAERDVGRLNEALEEIGRSEQRYKRRELQFRVAVAEKDGEITVHKGHEDGALKEVEALKLRVEALKHEMPGREEMMLDMCNMKLGASLARNESEQMQREVRKVQQNLGMEDNGILA